MGGLAKTGASSPGGETEYALYTINEWPHGANASNALPVNANNVFLDWVEVEFRRTIDQLGVVHGLSAGNNMRLGIYRDNGGLPDGGALLGETNAVARAGAFTTQMVNLITPVTLAPGLYWIGFVLDVNDTINRICVDAGFYNTRMFVSVFGALPNPCPATAYQASTQRKLARISSIP